MENIFAIPEKNTNGQSKPERTATIRNVGYNHPHFGTPQAGDLIGQEVELLYLYPVDGSLKTDLSYDHAIVQFPGKVECTLLIDCKLEFTGDGN